MINYKNIGICVIINAVIGIIIGAIMSLLVGPNLLWSYAIMSFFILCGLDVLRWWTNRNNQNDAANDQ